MPISTLNTIITGEYLSSLGSSTDNTKKIGLSKEPEEPLTLTLQRGARSAAASIQSLNAGVSFINVAKDYTQNMLNVVDALDLLVKKAGKGNITPSNAKVYRVTFDRLADAYEELVKGSVVKGRDLLSVTDMSRVLKDGGLDPEKVDELEVAFRKISSFSGVADAEGGSVANLGALFPPEDFYRAIRQATRDPEAPPEDDDGSAAFGKIRIAVKAIRAKVSKNIEALEDASELVGKNLELVRATGFAFLKASDSITGSESPETVAYQVRGAIRATASQHLSEIHNLESILAAGLLALSEKSD